MFRLEENENETVKLTTHRGCQCMLPEGQLKGLTLKVPSLQGVHEDICIGGGHLIAHCCSLYLLVDMCGKSI